MDAVVRPAAPADLPAITRLSDGVFRGGATAQPSMADMFLHLFNDANAKNLIVAEVDGAIVSLVGAALSPVQIGSARLLVAGVGSVCTDPGRRGEGYAGQCLELAVAQFRASGVHLLWVSGDRSLYRRCGCRPAGAFNQFTCTDAQWTIVPSEIGVDIDSDDLSALGRLGALEPVRFVRSPELFGTLLASWRHGARDRHNTARAVALVRRRLQPVAWVAYTVADQKGSKRLRIDEYAGERSAIAHAVPILAQTFQAERITMLAPAHDTVWPTALSHVTGTEWQVQPTTNPGHTFVLLDAGRTLSALASYFAETGVTPPYASAPEDPAVDASHQQAAQLTEALFAPGPCSARVPLPASGISYV